VSSTIKNCLLHVITQQLKRQAIRLYDNIVATTAAVARQARLRVSKSPGFCFSVGIPHYNQGSFIARPLRNLLNNPAVSEVVIVDDGSNEVEFDELNKQVSKIDKRGKVKIFRREENRGAMLTKLECVERSTSDWVLVLDCDNTAFKGYLNRLAPLKNRCDDTIYCANWAFPYFPFHELSGMSIDFQQARDFLQNGILKRKYLLNDGNYLVNRRRYSEIVSLIGRLPSDVVDVLVVNYLWLSKGGKLEVIPGAKYMHRVNSSSFWSQTAEASKKRLLEIYARLEGAVPWDEDFLQKLRSGLV